MDEGRSAAPRLIDYLRAQKLTNREARDLLDTGKVSYCGVPTADGGREVDAARVLVQHSAPRIRPGRDLAIIHRDQHMVVVYKPPGMLAVSAAGRRDARSVIGVVRHLLGEAFPVHRLDEPNRQTEQSWAGWSKVGQGAQKRYTCFDTTSP